MRPVYDDRRWLAELDDDQRRAVVHRGSPLLVVAGAGSGKTRTIAARVADLVADGVDPQRILLLTFTRRAAREVLGRAAAATDERARGVRGGTFHSVAHGLLRRHGTAVGVDPDFTLLDQADSADLLAILRAELDLATAGSRVPRKDTLAAIYSRVVNSRTSLSAALDRWFPWCRAHAEDLRTLFQAYTARKRTHGVLDLDDLLLFWLALARTPVGVNDVDHVLVDEYQDTNAVQADILAALTAHGACVTAVGDDAQAIYGFRAATVANLEEFEDRFPGTTVVTLDRNYRSTPQILDAANAILAPAPRRYPRELRACRPSGPRPTWVTCADEPAQSAWVARTILEQRERGVDLRDQAVLVRTGHHTTHLELELARRDIPFVKFGGLRFLDTAHVKDVLALLRILDNPRDGLAWSRVLGTLDGVGPATVRRALDTLGVGAVDRDGDVEALDRFLHDPPVVPPRARDDLVLLLEGLGRATTDAASSAPATQLEALRPFLERTITRRYDDAVARLRDLDQLADLAGSHPDRATFLAHLVLDPPASTQDLAGPPVLDDEYVVLSTIHSAKGGEWRVVFVLHAADGNLPSDLATGDPETLEEERRLLYVAVTRARDELHVTVPVRYDHTVGDGHTFAQPSRFLVPARDRFEPLTVGVGGSERSDPDDGVPLVVTAGGTADVDRQLDELFAG